MNISAVGYVYVTIHGNIESVLNRESGEREREEKERETAEGLE